MSVNPPWSVLVDLDRVRANAEEIVRAVGVPVHAVVKADAYGLGMRGVVDAIGGVVQGFCVFGLSEARRLGVNKPILCLGPPEAGDAAEYLAIGARPAVSNVLDARRLRAAHPALCVDTGMQRFACPAEEVAEALAAGECTEAFTHAVRAEQAGRLVELAGGKGVKLHAAGSSLMNDPACRLDAVRPGMALYRGAVRVSTRLVEVRDTRGPAGYRGFEVPRHGVILAGYTQGLRPGPCLVNGRRSRVIEVGMQTAFVQCEAKDSVGDEAVLLGDGLDADEIGAEWKASGQEVLVSLLRSHPN